MGYCASGAGWTLHHGNAIAVLQSLPDASVDGVIADPPYASGGATTTERRRKPERKYQQSAYRDLYPTFLGEARDQRAHLRWSSWWMERALRVAKPGAPLCVFTDWRQLPTTTDAIQLAGWTWRGIAVWDKTGSCRPCRGRFSAQAEFVVWASKGDMPADRGVGALPGVFRCKVDFREKAHIAGKPVKLMREVIEIVPAGGVVLDPFAGSGSTGLAALSTGREFIGVELDRGTFELAAARMGALAAQGDYRSARAGQGVLFA